MCWWFVYKQVDCTSGFSVGSKNHGWSADPGAATGQKGYSNNGPGNAVATGWSSLSQWGLGETGSWIFQIYSSTQPRWFHLPSLYNQRFRRLGSKIPDALNVVFCSGSNISSNVACRQQFSTWFHGFVDDLQMPCQNMPWNHLCVVGFKIGSSICVANELRIVLSSMSTTFKINWKHRITVKRCNHDTNLVISTRNLACLKHHPACGLNMEFWEVLSTWANFGISLGFWNTGDSESWNRLTTFFCMGMRVTPQRTWDGWRLKLENVRWDVFWW